MEADFSLAGESLQLECTSKGTPLTATLWSRDDILITETDREVFESSSLENGNSLSYTSTLELGAQDTGLYSCDMYREWRSATTASSGRESESRSGSLGGEEPSMS